MRNTQQVLKMKADLFTDTNVSQVKKDEAWASIVDKVKKNPEHTVMVVDEDNILNGIITDQDVLEAISTPELTQKVQEGGIVAGDIMTPVDPTKSTVARDSDNVGDAIEILRGENELKRALRVLPVVNQKGTVIGQITRDSIQRRLNELLE